jgi:hypothetical protein
MWKTVGGVAKDSRSLGIASLLIYGLDAVVIFIWIVLGISMDRPVGLNPILIVVLTVSTLLALVATGFPVSAKNDPNANRKRSLPSAGLMLLVAMQVFGVVLFSESFTVKGDPEVNEGHCRWLLDDGGTITCISHTRFFDVSQTRQTGILGLLLVATCCLLQYQAYRMRKLRKSLLPLQPGRS